MSGFRVIDEEGPVFVECLACGADATWVECTRCVDGFTGHDCGEDTCCCADPEDNVECDVCDGDEGWYLCTNRDCSTRAAERAS